MMTRRLRATVSREIKYSTMLRSTKLDQGEVGFLQEVLSSCGKQSSSIFRELQLWQLPEQI